MPIVSILQLRDNVLYCQRRVSNVWSLRRHSIVGKNIFVSAVSDKKSAFLVPKPVINSNWVSPLIYSHFLDILQCIFKYFNKPAIFTFLGISLFWDWYKRWSRFVRSFVFTCLKTSTYTSSRPELLTLFSTSRAQITSDSRMLGPLSSSRMKLESFSLLYWKSF